MSVFPGALDVANQTAVEGRKKPMVMTENSQIHRFF